MSRRQPPALLCLSLSLCVPAVAGAGPEAGSASVWSALPAPAFGPARSIGSYSAGCVQGAAELALDGPGFRVMRPSRRRTFGHPALVDYVRALGKSVQGEGLGVVLVGDLGQPRGGPAPSGHASHQTGLDVDIWYWQPARPARKRLSRRDRERLAPREIVSARTGAPTRDFAPRILRVLELAASDPRVARIFVHPGVKRELCKRAGAERGWLRKVRPWFGHNRHFHVRLECPGGSPECQPQPPIPEGDGCAELDWWFDEEAQKDRKAEQEKYRGRVGGAPVLPAGCTEVRHR